LDLPYDTSSTQTYAGNTIAQHAVHLTVYQLHIHSIQRGSCTSVFVSNVTSFFSKIVSCPVHFSIEFSLSKNTIFFFRRCLLPSSYGLS